MPSLWNIALLVFVVFYIFSVLGLHLFGDIAFTERGLTRHAHFRDWPTAILTLFR